MTEAIVEQPGYIGPVNKGLHQYCMHLTDVTLVLKDGQYLPAHNVILSETRTFFIYILKKNSHHNTLIDQWQN